MLSNDSIRTMDANILLSILNMKLRDNYSSLEKLCDDMDIEENILVKRLEELGYTYEGNNNQFSYFQIPY